MPAFCRVAATLTPSSDSDIAIEVWMPASSWNRRFEGVGNGGLAGAIPYSALAPGVSLGYATVGTDTGHIGSSSYDGTFALGHPEKIIDFGYRSIHLMTVIGKQIASAYYGENAKRSYFTGCSTGGRQALMEAQRFSDDYDGIVAGDPVAYYTHHHVGGNLWVVRQMFNNPASTVFTTEDTLLGNAVNAACDALDGVADGVLNDPRGCHFDPAELLCEGSQMPPNCLTAEQVEAVRNLWTGPDQMVHQHGYYPPFERGGEGRWLAFKYLSRTAACAANRRSRADWPSLLRVLRLRQSELGLSNFQLDLRTSLRGQQSGRSRSDFGVGSELD
jgi:feruloyl esterase